MTTTMPPKPLHKQTNGVGSRAMLSNILDVFSRATNDHYEAGMVWYDDAHRVAQSMSEVSGRPVESCAVALAHLSPQVAWPENVRLGLAMAAPESEYLYPTRAENRAAQVTYANWRKAFKSMYWDDTPLDNMTPNIKTHSFAHNILGHMDYVTLDTWAFRIAGVDYRYAKRVGVYAGLANVYSKAAHMMGIEPAQMQAITWVTAHDRDVMRDEQGDAISNQAA